MALPGLAVLLTLICCSMTTGHAISDPDPPIKNLRIDPERKRLVWDQHGNVSEIGCYINSKILRKATKNPYCTLGDLSCEVKNYTVKVMKGQPFSDWILYPKQGNPRAAADNLTCRVHDVDQLSCSWAVGEEAPADVQYRFYLKQPVETWQCPKYTKNQQGVNVQCHFHSISLQPQRQAQFRFLVNGTGGGSEIPCRVMIHRLQEIEVLAAPNITKKWCSENYSFIEWEVRSLFTEDIKYELEIQKGKELAYKEETELKSLRLRNPGPYTVKVKAMDSLFFGRRPPGQWSAPQHLDCGSKSASFPLWLVYLLAPLGALLLVGFVFLCRRWPVMRQLFPRVPHVKDPVGDSFQNETMMAWDPGQESQEECAVVQVQVLGEA
ncbi:interleukin-3 receptor subunit alpha [Oryx dammah]|uniref:interleukin-3 receptor subunit alpha n=1 Tax=Oryx dammah TaxID=59534 RepID=UPI001A9AE736|nr:interleukin-3 receptor subunit alpha [Oryx dammah]XP_040122356.1 interleukin-3 receptor subunit alpha [Oryx dammah]